MRPYADTNFIVSLFCEGPNTAEAEELHKDIAHRHTAKGGFRTYDILHVSSALVLVCDTFWSFDAKAKRLASLEGLAVN